MVDERAVNKTFNPIRCLLAAAVLLTGQPVLGDAVDSLAPGHWYEIPNTRLSAVLPNPLPPSRQGTGRAESIVDEWSGGAFDTRRSWLLVWGGGHNNYSGNEVYAFDMNTLQWRRLTDPSTDVGGSETTGYYPDGLPRSRHTYDYVEYVPSIDRFCSFGGAAQYPDGNTETDNLDCLNPASGSWETSVYQDVPKRAFESNINAVSAYDPVQDYVYLHTTWIGDDPRLMRWKPTPGPGGTWEVLTGYDWIGDDINAAIHPQQRVMVALGAGEFWVWDLDNPTAGQLQPATSGDSAIENQPAPGLAYDPVSNLLVAWNGGTDVYLLEYDDAAGWGWSVRAPAPGNSVIPSAGTAVGTYGRFRYVPSRNVFVVVNSIHENVYVYRLSPGSGTGPVPGPPGAGGGGGSGGSSSGTALGGPLAALLALGVFHCRRTASGPAAAAACASRPI